jgi:hypothetical protein
MISLLLIEEASILQLNSASFEVRNYERAAGIHPRTDLNILPHFDPPGEEDTLIGAGVE